MFSNKKNILCTLITIFLFTGIYAQSQGESLFKENKPKEAVQVLENEILNGLVTANTYNFLGLGYYQLGEYAKSIDAFNRGIAAQPTLAKTFLYNQGNSYYALKDYTSAIRCYSDVLKDNPTFYDALLNRANALLMASQLKDARTEYIDYIAKCPNDPQRPEIEKLIKALEEEIVRREEEERLFAEQNKAKWEEYDASINDEKVVAEEEKNPDWEEVDAKIAEEKKKEQPPVTPKEEPKTEWEQVDYKVSEQNQENPKTPWEKVNEDKLSAAEKQKLPDELVTEDNWQNLSEEDQDELKELDKSSKEERERWLAEQKRQKELEKQREIEKENEIKNAEKLRKQQLEEEERLAKERREEEDRLRKQKIEDEERLAREKLMEEMMRAENERKQKLLENLANSLQNSETTNMTSGADDIIDYDLEGELD